MDVLINQDESCMEWRPNKLVAVLLGLFSQSIAMLYLDRLKWAAFYLFIPLLVVSSEFLLSAPWLSYFSISPIFSVICAIHAYRIAANSAPVSVRPWYGEWYGLLGIFATFVMTVYFMRSFFYEPFKMPSGSMLPTIPIGAHIIVRKYGYGNYGSFGIPVRSTAMSEKIERGDLVVFRYPPDPSISFTKRVIGLPGDSLAFKDHRLTINNEQVLTESIMLEGDQDNMDPNVYHFMRESFNDVTYNIAYMHNKKSAPFELTVPENSYFLMGDNRDRSNDSRYWGFVDNKSIIGKVIFITHN